jgi:hypothetical protein
LNQGTSLSNVSEQDLHVVIGRMQEELQTLVRQREEVVRRIGTVKKTVAGLMALFDDYPVDEKLAELLGEKRSQRRAGLSKECRFALMNAEQPLSAREVCARVQVRLPTLANHKDALASVTTVLNRLVNYGEAYDLVMPGGTRRWAWATENNPKQPSAAVE